MDNHSGEQRITVCAPPHGRTQRKNALFGGKVRLEIISNTLEQHKDWINRIRAEYRHGTYCNKKSRLWPAKDRHLKWRNSEKLLINCFPVPPTQNHSLYRLIQRRESGTNCLVGPTRTYGETIPRGKVK